MKRGVNNFIKTFLFIGVLFLLLVFLGFVQQEKILLSPYNSVFENQKGPYQVNPETGEFTLLEPGYIETEKLFGTYKGIPCPSGIDSDGGVNINKYGIIDFRSYGTEFYFDDYCIDANTIREYSCKDSNTLALWQEKCAPGRTCVNGECKNIGINFEKNKFAVPSMGITILLSMPDSQGDCTASEINISNSQGLPYICKYDFNSQSYELYLKKFASQGLEFLGTDIDEDNVADYDYFIPYNLDNFEEYGVYADDYALFKYQGKLIKQEVIINTDPVTISQTSMAHEIILNELNVNPSMIEPWDRERTRAKWSIDLELFEQYADPVVLIKRKNEPNSKFQLLENIEAISFDQENNPIVLIDTNSDALISQVPYLNYNLELQEVTPGGDILEPVVYLSKGWNSQEESPLLEFKGSSDPEAENYFDSMFVDNPLQIIVVPSSALDNLDSINVVPEPQLSPEVFLSPEDMPYPVIGYPNRVPPDQLPGKIEEKKTYEILGHIYRSKHHVYTITHSYRHSLLDEYRSGWFTYTREIPLYYVKHKKIESAAHRGPGVVYDDFGNPHWILKMYQLDNSKWGLSKTRKKTIDKDSYKVIKTESHFEKWGGKEGMDYFVEDGDLTRWRTKDIREYVDEDYEGALTEKYKEKNYEVRKRDYLIEITAKLPEGIDHGCNKRGNPSVEHDILDIFERIKEERETIYADKPSDPPYVQECTRGWLHYYTYRHPPHDQRIGIGMCVPQMIDIPSVLEEINKKGMCPPFNNEWYRFSLKGDDKPRDNP